MRIKRTFQKLFFTLFILLILFGTTAIHPQQVEAAEKISNACAKAYAKKLNSLVKKNSPDVKGYSFTIVRDMNKDGVPELLYTPGFSGSIQQPWSVYTYKKGKVKKLGNCAGTLYTVSGQKTKYKFESWFGVGCTAYGYVTFGKSKITTQTKAEYIGPDCYLSGKKSKKTKCEKYVKNFCKSMTKKKSVKMTDVYDIQWNAAKIKKILS